MERVRQSGKRIGRPSAAAESEDIQFEESDRVSDETGFAENFTEVLKRIESGTLSRRKAALALGIGYAILKRLLDNDKAKIRYLHKDLVLIGIRPALSYFDYLRGGDFGFLPWS